jgi:hypothetical protein
MKQALTLLLFAGSFAVAGAQESNMNYKIEGGNRTVSIPQDRPGRVGNVALVPLSFINVSQFAAHVNKPTIGPPGYQLYFVDGMSIGGKQCTEVVDSVMHAGIYIIADFLRQGEEAHPGDIGKSFIREKIFCVGVFPNGREFRYPENGGPYKIQTKY